MADEDPQIDLGAANPDELAKVALSSAGTYSDPELPPLQRFMDGAIKAVRNRHANPNAANDPQLIAVFVLSDQPKIAAQPHGAISDPLFSNGSCNLNGHLWFTQAAVTAGFSIDITDKAVDAIFDLIENDLDAGALPTIFFDPRATWPEIRFYPNGVSDTDQVKILEIADKEVTTESVIDELNLFYDQCLRTPECNVKEGRVWKNARKWIPVERAEAQVQSVLKPYLVAAFGRSFDIRLESSTDEGRADVFIVERPTEPGGNHVYHAVLELKVFKSLTSGGNEVPEGSVATAVSDGLDQAIAYKEARQVRLAFLCCYDMRKMDHELACFDHEKERAEQLEVSLNRWYLFNTSKTVRAAKYRL